MKLTVNLRSVAFEGPLDLLLSLIRKNKMRIADVSVSVIVEQYMSAIADLERMDVEFSSEFLVLAATLLHIKSRELLPKRAEDEDVEIAKDELIRRLLEYQHCKATAAFLAERESIGGRYFFKKRDDIQPIQLEEDASRNTPEAVLAAYLNAFSKLERRLPPPKKSFAGIVGHERASVRVMMRGIWRRLTEGGKLLFSDIFAGSGSKPEVVARFLAVLELIKFNRIRVQYNKRNQLMVCREEGALGDIPPEGESEDGFYGA